MGRQNYSEEIDINFLFKKLSDSVKRCIRGIFLMTDFFMTNWLIILGIILGGILFGYVLDTKEREKIFTNQLIVIPNFGSVNYLYDKIETINYKVKAKDTIFLKSILDTNYRKLKSITIEPISDTYNYVAKSKNNTDLFRIMTEKQDPKKISQNFDFTKNFKYHRMIIRVQGSNSSKKIADDIISYINGNSHFLAYKDVFNQNKELELMEHTKMISQIDSLIAAAVQNQSRISPSSIEIVNSSNQHELITSKKSLISELANLQIQKLDFSEPIKIVSADFNIYKKRMFDLSKKILIPIVLLFAFFGFSSVIFMAKRLRIYAFSY